MTVRVGIDVGGTFTDLYLLDEASAPAMAVKQLTTPENISDGILQGLRKLHAASGIAWADITEVTVGTTLGLNAVLQGRGTRTGLITTVGFRDVLEIARENRDQLYNLQEPPARTIVPRHLRIEVNERISGQGEILTPLDVASELPRLLAWIDEHDIRSLAICFINSYLVPDHEEMLRDALQLARPDQFISASVDVQRSYREYERTLVTCMDAYIGPIVSQHLKTLKDAILSLAANARVRITDSLGSAVGVDAAERRPVLTLMSGPASGVAGAGVLSKQVATNRDVIAMDMGGTSCDITVIQDGEPDVRATVQLGRHRFSLQTIDVHSIGAGGGTIAWVDDGGLLRVGPQSAGSSPGPACYGRGGQEPTITDAHVVLGHLSPAASFGGEIELDLAGAQRSIQKYVAEPLGLPIRDAAAGILRIADAEMRRAVETITIRRGLDPRKFSFVAYGGAAPLHAASIARELGIGEVIIPDFAGVLCAVGAVCAPERYEVGTTWLRPSKSVSPAALAAVLAELEELAWARAVGAEVASVRREVALDMRFLGQTATLRVAVADPDSEQAIETAVADFNEQYQRVFGYVLPDTESEIERVSLRLAVQGTPITLQLRATDAPLLRPVPWRAAFDSSELIDCDLWDLSTGGGIAAPIAGPAVVALAGSTAVIHAEQEASIDRYGNMIIRAMP